MTTGAPPGATTVTRSIVCSTPSPTCTSGVEAAPYDEPLQAVSAHVCPPASTTTRLPEGARTVSQPAAVHPVDR